MMKYAPYSLLALAGILVYLTVNRYITMHSINVVPPIGAILCIIFFFVWRNHLKQQGYYDD